MSNAIVVSVTNILCVLSCIMYMFVFYIWARSLTQINKKINKKNNYVVIHSSLN